MADVYSQGPDGAEQGLLAACRGEKHGKRNDLGSERGGEHLRYITQPNTEDPSSGLFSFPPPDLTAADSETSLLLDIEL